MRLNTKRRDTRLSRDIRQRMDIQQGNSEVLRQNNGRVTGWDNGKAAGQGNGGTAGQDNQELGQGDRESR